jgi:hypothetical protein
MGARLSRRFGAASYYPPLLWLPPVEKLALSRLTEERNTAFEDLPARYQRLIIEAEATMLRYLEAGASGGPEALQRLLRDAASHGGRERLAVGRRRGSRPAEAALPVVAAEPRG